MTGSTLASFRFRGLESDGRLRRGTLQAPDIPAAVEQLRRENVVPLEVVATAFGRRSAALSAQETAIGLRIIADGLRAGLSLSRALELLDDFAGPGWAARLPLVRQALSEGRAFSAAIDRAGLGVPELLLAMIRAGEASGEVAESLDRAAAEAQRSVARQRALQGALAYPALVAASGTLSVVVMVGVVLPRFAAILADFNQSLPPLTAAVLRTGELARALLLPGSLALVVLGALALRWRRTGEGRLRADRLLLRLPIIGSFRHSTATAKACSALAALLEGGIPIRRAIAIATQTTGDAELNQRSEAAVASIVTGASVGAALSHSGLFTEAATRLVAAGAQSGRLAPMVRFAGQREEERVERQAQLALKFAEPLLITAFALVVAVIAVAMLQAVYAVRPM